MTSRMRRGDYQLSDVIRAELDSSASSEHVNEDMRVMGKTTGLEWMSLLTV